jgi:hypothetical protein
MQPNGSPLQSISTLQMKPLGLQIPAVQDAPRALIVLNTATKSDNSDRRLPAQITGSAFYIDTDLVIATALSDVCRSMPAISMR